MKRNDKGDRRNSVAEATRSNHISVFVPLFSPLGLAACCCLIPAVLLPGNLGAEERGQALFLTGTAGMSFQADARVYFGVEGTVEFSLAAPADMPQDGFPVVMAHGNDDEGENFRITVDPHRKFVRMERGESFMDVTVDLTDGEFHHIAFCVRGNTGYGFVDGIMKESYFRFRFDEKRNTGLPLLLGRVDAKRGFQGHLRMVRLWNRALAEWELSRISASRSLPPQDLASYPHLMAYSRFTDTDIAILYPQPEILSTPWLGPEGGDEIFLRRPQGLELVSVYMLKGKEGQRTVSDIVAEYDQSMRFFDRFGNGPIIIQPSVSPANSEALQAAFNQAVSFRLLIEQFDPSRPPDESNLRRLREELKTYQDTMRQLQLGYADAANTNGTDIGEENPATRVSWRAFRIRTGAKDTIADESIQGIAASWDAGQITSVRLRTGLTDHDTYPGVNQGSPETGCVMRPPGSRFEGLRLRRDTKGIIALAIAWSLPEHDQHVRQALEASEGVWLDRSQREPVRDDALYQNQTTILAANDAPSLHGNYTDQLLFRLRYNPDTRELTLMQENGSSPQPMIQTRWIHRRGNYWINVGETTSGREMCIYPDRIHLRLMADASERILLRSAPYDPPGPDKIAWGGTFTLDQHPATSRASFMGYDPVYMSPRDFQAFTGSTRLLFQYPAEASKDYFFTENRVIVPHGFIFRADNKGSERSSSVTSASAQEAQAQWGIGLGLKMGIPLVASFSGSGEYSTQMEKMLAEKSVSCISRTLETRYALVLDHARVRLDAVFAARVLELRDALILGRRPDFRSFFNLFGTHYPYAVTYGGMACLETWYTHQEYSEFNSQSINIEAEGSATLEGILSIGGSVKANTSWGSRMKQELASDESVFATYGGSISRGDGWSIGRGEEVPVLLDLRPVSELFSPVYFDDPVVWASLRTECAAQLHAHIKALTAIHMPAWGNGTNVDWAAQINELKDEN